MAVPAGNSTYNLRCSSSLTGLSTVEAAVLLPLALLLALLLLPPYWPLPCCLLQQATSGLLRM
jgi:hypothetical protein